MNKINKIYNYIDRMADKLAMLMYKVLFAILLYVILLVVLVHIYEEYMYGTSNKVHAMYDKIAAQTGQAQDVLPLYIVEDDTDNAFNDGTKIVMYTGLIKRHSWDSIALVLGHEIAHGTLAHLNETPPFNDGHDEDGSGFNDHIAVLEANADKLGAVYMMKAGYNICKGREVYMEWRAEKGNHLGMTHPDYSYRYDELNINCGGN